MKYLVALLLNIAFFSTAFASAVEDLILLCRGGMDVKSVAEVSAAVEGKLSKQVNPIL